MLLFKGLALQSTTGARTQREGKMEERMDGWRDRGRDQAPAERQ